VEDWIRRQLLERQKPNRRSPVLFQRWLHLLFLHWAVPPDLVQRTLPHGLQADTFEGKSWIGIVPFFMRAVRPAGFVSVPGVSNFLELNLRTYVRDLSGRPGIWFYSLDANQAIAVCLARAAFALPYRFARMRARVTAGEIDYWSHRFGSKKALRYRYRPSEPLGEAEFGSLEFFLIERYRLFACRGKRLLTGQVYHSPYQLRNVSLSHADPDLFAMDGFDTPTGPPAHILYSRRLDVNIYPIDLVNPDG